MGAGRTRLDVAMNHAKAVDELQGLRKGEVVSKLFVGMRGGPQNAHEALLSMQACSIALHVLIALHPKSIRPIKTPPSACDGKASAQFARTAVLTSNMQSPTSANRRRPRASRPNAPPSASSKRSGPSSWRVKKGKARAPPGPPSSSVRVPA